MASGLQTPPPDCGGESDPEEGIGGGWVWRPQVDYFMVFSAFESEEQGGHAHPRLPSELRAEGGGQLHRQSCSTL